MLRDLKIIITADSSNSIWNEEVGESYHSDSGAVAESEHVFIESALHFHPSPDPAILEIGFGTGLNAYLTWIDTLVSGKFIKYTAVELHPLAVEWTEKLNYPEILNQSRQVFLDLHHMPWEKENRISDHFYIKKAWVDLSDFKTSEKYDIVYFDAFSPKVQPGLWTAEIFTRIFNFMNPGGILTTYCSKGDVRRSMLAAGFHVEKIPGPGKKREITRASKKY